MLSTSLQCLFKQIFLYPKSWLGTQKPVSYYEALGRSTPGLTGSLHLLWCLGTRGLCPFDSVQM